VEDAEQIGSSTTPSTHPTESEINYPPTRCIRAKAVTLLVEQPSSRWETAASFALGD
jgi:hypothetical protein